MLYQQIYSICQMENHLINKYVVDLIKVAKEYKEKFPVLYTTVKKWGLKGIKEFFS